MRCTCACLKMQAPECDRGMQVPSMRVRPQGLSTLLALCPLLMPRWGLV